MLNCASLRGKEKGGKGCDEGRVITCEPTWALTLFSPTENSSIYTLNYFYTIHSNLKYPKAFCIEDFKNRSFEFVEFLNSVTRLRDKIITKQGGDLQVRIHIF